MECSCVYVEAECQAEFFREVLRTARKEHRCCECHRTILPGEKYEYVSGMWEGKFDTYKTCIDCLSIRNQFFCGIWEFGGSLEYLSEHISEMSGDIGESCLNSESCLTQAARERVCEMIEREWERYEDDE